MNPYQVFVKSLGQGSGISFGRLASAVTLMFCLGWDSAYVWFAMRHMDSIHITIKDVLPSYGALVSQIGFCTIFYGVNKLKASMDGKTSPENGQK